MKPQFLKPPVPKAEMTPPSLDPCQLLPSAVATGDYSLPVTRLPMIVLAALGRSVSARPQLVSAVKPLLSQHGLYHVTRWPQEPLRRGRLASVVRSGWCLALPKFRISYWNCLVTSSHLVTGDMGTWLLPCHETQNCRCCLHVLSHTHADLCQENTTA